MIRKEDLEQRLKDLGWTLYKLAKQFSEMRAVDGDVSPATRYHTSIGKAMENPAKSRLETIEGVVQALNGELTIVWEPRRVVTIRLDDQSKAVLEERAKTDGTTITEVAEQLLQLALSRALAQQKTKKNTNLVLGNSALIPRSFHPNIASAYTAVHEWLTTRPEAEGYRQLDYSEDLSRCLKPADLQSAAFQYYALFPRHYFETAHILEKVINSTKLLNWLKYNPRLCILDVGCAQGAASAAFIEAILVLQEQENLPQSIEIFCLGIDPNVYGVTLYSKLMQEIKHNLRESNINLEFQVLCERVPKAIIPAIRHLKEKRKQWDKPYLSNVFLMQLDITSSLSKTDVLKKEQYEKLRQLGIESDLLVEGEEELWQEEALAYKQLFEEVPIDHLHIMTIGTKNIEKRIQEMASSKKVEDCLQELVTSIKQVVRNNARFSLVSEGVQQVNFENPVGSYWKTQYQQDYTCIYYANFCTIASKLESDDKDWDAVISIANLELAWVRARHNLLSIESLYDEIEIRVFEKNLNNNLLAIRQQLISYYEDVVPTNEKIPYNFVKSSSSTRPKQLSRLEEEILSTAIVQKFGEKAEIRLKKHIYANRPVEESYGYATEYLYEAWWDGYQRFINDVRTNAAKYEHGHGVVIRTDIKAYYTTVVQEQLLEITNEQLNITSERIRWLLRKVISNDLPGHEPGLGLSQGTITSGFYANFYLSSVDAKFVPDNRWKVKFYRYADDMILIVPSDGYVDEVKSVLENELTKLGLSLNEHKTQIYLVSQFLKELKNDERLKQLGDNFNHIINPLWIMNSNYRAEFEFAYLNDNLWWHLIKRYQQCLRSINIYITEPGVSRKIYKYIFNPRQCERDLSREQELKLPAFPNGDNFTVISDWARGFENSEAKWLEDRDNLRTEIVKLFKESLEELRQVDISTSVDSSTSKDKRRKIETRIRFAVNKLSVLGFAEVWEDIAELLCGDELFVIRNLLYVVTSLARQGYRNAISKLWQYYQNSKQQTSEYIRAVIIEAMRFLPNLTRQNWELIVELATASKSDVERLKATETWLYLGDVSRYFVQKQHIQAVISALNSNPRPITRLQKNYILILGMHEPEAIPELDIKEDDYLLRDALNIALKEKVSDLFKEYEPAVVRQYYSGQRPANEDESESIPSL